MFKNIAAGVLIVIGLFMLLGFFNADLDGGFLVSTVAFLIAVVLPIGAGALLLYQNQSRSQQLAQNKRVLGDQVLQSEILKLAKRQKGKLTATEVAAEFALPSEKADAVLDKMVVRGIAEAEVSEAGVVVYAFYEAGNLGHKDSAKGVLDV